MQGTRVWSLVWEDSTCHRAAKPSAPQLLKPACHIVKAMVFPVVTSCMNIRVGPKEGWVPKNWCFWIVMLEKTLESPMDSKENKPVNPEYLLEGVMLKLQYFGHLMRKANLLEKTLMLGKTEGKGKGGSRRWDSITDLMDMNLSKPQGTVEDRGAWRAAVLGVAKSWTSLSDWTTTNHKQLQQKVKQPWSLML